MNGQIAIQKRVLVGILVTLFPIVSLSQTYQDVADQIGIDHTFGEGNTGAGVSFYDFDGDGWDDITLATQEGDQNRFYKNTGGAFPGNCRSGKRYFPGQTYPLGGF